MRDGLTSELFLHERLNALRVSGRAGCRRLLAILEGDEISRRQPSWLERRYVELIDAAGLPKPRTEVTLTRARDKLVRVDCHFEGTDVVVELLGYRWHRTKEQIARDAERLNELQLVGFRGFQFTYGQVVDTPEYVVDVTRRALGISPPLTGLHRTAAPLFHLIRVGRGCRRGHDAMGLRWRRTGTAR